MDADVLRQAEATMARPAHTLPEAWSDPEAIANMAAWIERFIPEANRPTFRYGAES